MGYDAIEENKEVYYTSPPVIDDGIPVPNTVAGLGAGGYSGRIRTGSIPSSLGSGVVEGGGSIHTTDARGTVASRSSDSRNGNSLNGNAGGEKNGKGSVQTKQAPARSSASGSGSAAEGDGSPGPQSGISGRNGDTRASNAKTAEIRTGNSPSKEKDSDTDGSATSVSSPTPKNPASPTPMPAPKPKSWWERFLEWIGWRKP